MAQFSIVFEGGASAYIPANSKAAERLAAKGLPSFQPPPFVVNETMKIPMEMTQAIELGILDTETVEKIQQFLTVCRNPNWTYWHQLKRFFAHYKRDADAPMRCNSEKKTGILGTSGIASKRQTAFVDIPDTLRATSSQSVSR